MRKVIFFLIVFIYTNGALKAQGDIMLLPFLGGNTEDMIVYNSKTGELIQWYYDKMAGKTLKVKGSFKSRNIGTGFDDGRTMMQSYVGGGHARIILTWNTLTGQSVSWYDDDKTKKLEKNTLEYQLPAKIGLSGNVMMYAYLDDRNTEIILCWETSTGKSVSFYYNRTAKTFVKSISGYQLPENVGVSGKIMMHPYITKDGNEAVLVWDVNTGKSIAYYYEKNAKKYIMSPAGFQLPDTHEIIEEVMMYPYLGKDGSEDILVWSCKTGKSVIWNYDLKEKNFIQSPKSYQFQSGFTENVMMIPRVENDEERIYVWDSKTGQSINYVFDWVQKKYIKSAPEFQLPPNPFE